MTGRPGVQEKSGVTLVEEAVSLLRTAGLRTLSVYYIGAMPFVLAFAAFWAVMTHLPHMRAHLPAWALLLAVLFLWMKTWQARFCRMLLMQLQTGPPEAWSIRRFFRTCASQGLVQATGWIVIPCAFLCVLPAPWAYGLYQHCTVADDGEFRRTRDLLRESTSLNSLWPRQQLVTQWLLSPLLLFLAVSLYFAVLPVLEHVAAPLLEVAVSLVAGILIILMFPFSPLALILALNIGMGIFAAGYLLGALLGVHTLFTVAPGAAGNMAFAVIVCGLVYLCLDPAVKSAYVLRHFHGRSRRTGEDLLLSIRRVGAARVVLAAFALGICGSSLATAQATSPLTPEQLDAALEVELQDPRYAWREFAQIEYEDVNFILSGVLKIAQYVNDTLDRVKQWFQNVLDWLFGRDRDFIGVDDTAAPANWREMLRLVLILLSVALSLVVIIFALRLWRQQRASSTPPVPGTAQAAPDVEDERVTADKLPEEGWLALAQEYLAKGEYRFAVRCVFLASLARLAAEGLIQIGRSKTNLDYRRELQRRAHSHPHLPPLFARSVALYEPIWYGEHPPTPQIIEELMHNEDALVPRAQE